jgi:hypothetical protein
LFVVIDLGCAADRHVAALNCPLKFDHATIADLGGLATLRLDTFKRSAAFCCCARSWSL